jgi:2-polyprenyl-6-hydroxyphenyl methylase/3-demethylubiquinone-9 3-methyltransferase
MNPVRFDFGQNWVDFSKQALTPEKVEQARHDFLRLYAGIDLRGKSFLDIGFGQGLNLLFAQEAGARVFGNDINPKCREALAVTAAVLRVRADVPVVIGSFLDDDVVSRIAGLNGPGRRFSVVHSWGVLHHTGEMGTALQNAASLVDDHGHLVLAIYNRHWSSPAWRFIKWSYCASPRWGRALLTGFFYPIIAGAKFCVTRKNPFRKNRGMDFYYDVVDWIGGYPYEYATRKEIESIVQPLGFSCIKFAAAEVPTGCNEFVFAKRRGSD